MAGQIVTVRDAGEAPCLQQRSHRRPLIEAVLEQQPAPGLQMDWRLLDQMTNRIETIRPGGQRQPRFVAQRGQMRIAFSDIGWVADDQLEGFTAGRPDGLEPTAQQPPHRQPQPLAVATRHRQRIDTDIHRRHIRLGRSTASQRQRNRTAAGAQIKHPRRRAALREQLQRPVDQRLGIGAWVQHRRSHVQIEPVELVPAGQIGHRHAVGAALQPVDPAARLIRVEPVLIMGQQPGARPADQVSQQHLRIEALHAPGPRQRQRFGQGWQLSRNGLCGGPRAHACCSSSASNSAARACCRAAITSSSAPSTIASSLYSVRLMRWSVSRPCGKL